MKISVIIPAYNAEKTLERCVKSVLRQAFSPEEILIVDDESRDGTAAVAERLERENGRVRLIRQKHEGVSAARNRGLAEARGEWILLLDADDALTDGAFSALSAGVSGGADACCGGILRGREKKRAAGSDIGKEAGRLLSGEELINLALARPTDLMTIHGWIFRRELCADTAFLRELRIGEDSEWVLRVLRKCRGASLLRTPVYRYMLSLGSMIHQWKPGKTDAYLKMLDAAGRDAGEEKNWPLFVLTTLLLILTHDVFHSANPAGPREQLREAERLAGLPVFREAFRRADLSGMDADRRATLLFLKKGRTRLVRLAVRIRQRQNARKI